MAGAHRSARTTRLVAAVAAALLLSVAVASCSSDGSDGASGTNAGNSTTTPADGKTGSTTTAPTSPPHECDQGASADKVTVADVPGTRSDRTLTSFDGTKIRLHWFPVDGASKAKPAPTILMGPGWSLAGDTNVDGAPLFGAISIRSLHDQGYNVLTWDPRGFGESEGLAAIDHKDTEGRDGQALLDWVATQPEAQLDGEGDPRVGMVGFSYGGGIQLTLAAIDCRVDAIAPGIAWNEIETSLFKNRTVKSGWGYILSNTGAGNVDPHISSAAGSSIETGIINPDDEEWFRSRGPGELVDQITTPTLIIQGTVDTLFTLDEGIRNYRSMRSRDVPTAMIWFCGGHGACLTDEGDPKRVEEVQKAWLARWLKGDEKVDTGPPFETIDQDGTSWTAADLPEPDGELTGSGSGTLQLTEASTTGGTPSLESSKEILEGLVAKITPSPAKDAVSVPIDTSSVSDDPTLALGAPKVTLTYTGTAPDGDKPTRLFAQIVDGEKKVVVGNQITPIEVVLDGKEHTVDVDLEVIAQRVQAGDDLTLQIVAVTPAYAMPRLGGSVDLSKIEVSVPTVSKGLTKR